MLGYAGYSTIRHDYNEQLEHEEGRNGEAYTRSAWRGSVVGGYGREIPFDEVIHTGVFRWCFLVCMSRRLHLPGL